MKTPALTEVKASAVEQRHFNPTGDLFPDTLPPIVAAVWPSPGTRADEALQALISAPQNQADYLHGWRLAAYVKELQYDGWEFIKRDISRSGCRRPIAEYRLDRTDPGTAAALASRQLGSIDTTLAGWLAFACVCALMLYGVSA